MKNRYIELMNRVLSAYTNEHIADYLERVKAKGLTEHGFPRLAANIGILISNGYRLDLTDMFLQMMDYCCENIPKVLAANDFSVKEIIFCILALENSGRVPKEKTNMWRKKLESIDPRRCYDCYAETESDEVHNWALFTGVSEYMRQYAGLCDSTEFIDTQIGSQLKWLDENGMYRDPNNPIVYDLVPRGLFAVLLAFGYNGRYRRELDECLKRTGILTLNMQSVSGEIPYGGRSNQFLHNEANFAVVMEYEAKRYRENGESEVAGEIENAIDKALCNIEAWLSEKPISHVKNRFPIESGYGCENYAYFDKYMITAASFLYAAYLVSGGREVAKNDKVPSRVPPLAFSLSDDFHKVFLKAGGYFLEFDTSADPHYDASGLGRVHKEGAPGSICLSVPCSAHPKYKLDMKNASDISLCAGYGCDGTLKFATDRSTVYRIKELKTLQTHAFLAIENVFEDGTAVSSAYTVSEGGVDIVLKGDGQLAYMLAAFDFDGREHAVQTLREDTLEIEYMGYKCVYKTSGKITELDRQGGNRNGHYRAYCACGLDELKLKIEISKASNS